jgi:hypothetical protein
MEAQVEIIRKKNQVVVSLLDKVSQFFDTLNFENFDVLFPIIDKTMIHYHKLKAELVAEYGVEKLMPFEPETFSKAKLVEKKFDNVVVVFSEEVKRLELELAANTSRKKLIAYKR